MALLLCEQFLSNCVVISLLPLLCNHGNLTLKMHLVITSQLETLIDMVRSSQLNNNRENACDLACETLWFCRIKIFCT